MIGVSNISDYFSVSNIEFVISQKVPDALDSSTHVFNFYNQYPTASLNTIFHRKCLDNPLIFGVQNSFFDVFEVIRISVKTRVEKYENYEYGREGSLSWFWCGSGVIYNYYI